MISRKMVTLLPPQSHPPGLFNSTTVFLGNTETLFHTMMTFGQSTCHVTLFIQSMYRLGKFSSCICFAIIGNG